MKWIIALIVLFVAGYMCVDGVHALATGSYIARSSGKYAGHLGPWSQVVRTVGINPLSGYMKVLFVGYGALWIIFLGFFLIDRWWARRALIVMAACALWYLWLGAICALMSLALLILDAPKNADGSGQADQ